MEESFLKKLKKFSRDNIHFLSTIGLIIGSLLLYIGLNWIAFPSIRLPYIAAFIDYLGEWNWWVLILSPILVFASLYFLYSNIRDRRKFNELIDTGSKATFVRNQDELEEIAFRLGTKYQDVFFDKKKELKVK